MVSLEAVMVVVNHKDDVETFMLNNTCTCVNIIYGIIL